MSFGEVLVGVVLVVGGYAAVKQVEKERNREKPHARSKPRQVPAHMEHSGYYVLQWFGPARGRPDVLGGPWNTKAAADKAATKYTRASKRIHEPISTRVRHFNTRTEAANAGA